jgi:hypothetical protein
LKENKEVDESAPGTNTPSNEDDLEFSHWVKFNLKTNETIKEGVSNPADDGAGKEKLK